jgi:hypothetical protein
MKQQYGLKFSRAENVTWRSLARYGLTQLVVSSGNLQNKGLIACENWQPINAERF